MRILEQLVGAAVGNKDISGSVDALVVHRREPLQHAFEPSAPVRVDVHMIRAEIRNVKQVLALSVVRHPRTAAVGACLRP